MLNIITVLRFDYSKNHTKSIIFVNDLFFCFGMEPENKFNNTIKGQRDLIPEGTYSIILSKSPKFKRILPEILNVPNNSGIRIHPGNYPSDTSGCLILGSHFNENILLNSTKRVDELIFMLKVFEKAKDINRITYKSAEIDLFNLLKKF